jgi:hypothetical protein
MSTECSHLATLSFLLSPKESQPFVNSYSLNHMRQVKQRQYSSVRTAKAAIIFIRLWDTIRLSLRRERVLSRKYHVMSFLSNDKRIYRVVRLVVTQSMLDDLNKTMQEDSTAALEDSLYDTTHRTCQACLFQKNGVKTRRAIAHTCGKFPIRKKPNP